MRSTGSLRRPSDTAFHPAIVSGVLFGGTSSCGSRDDEVLGLGDGRRRRRDLVPIRYLAVRAVDRTRGPTALAHDLRGDGFFEAGGGLGIERTGDGL